MLFSRLESIQGPEKSRTHKNNHGSNLCRVRRRVTPIKDVMQTVYSNANISSCFHGSNSRAISHTETTLPTSLYFVFLVGLLIFSLKLSLANDKINQRQYIKKFEQTKLSIWSEECISFTKCIQLSWSQNCPNKRVIIWRNTELVNY